LRLGEVEVDPGRLKQTESAVASGAAISGPRPGAVEALADFLYQHFTKAKRVQRD